MSDSLKKYNLGFFMTEKVRLGRWHEAGILSREIAPYNLLAEKFNKIYLFTYFGRDELAFGKYLVDNVEIVYKRWRMPGSWYRWLLPILHWRTISQCQVIKTNQFKARAALIAKLLKPSLKFVLRTGYIPSLFAKQRGEQVSGFFKLWEYLAYKICDVALVTSQQDKDYLAEKYQLSETKVKLVANYIDTDLFKPNPAIEKIEKRVVYVGNLTRLKNIVNLVKALGGLDLALDIVGGQVGKGDEGLKEEIVRIARELGVEANFKGQVANNELPNILNQYEIFVLPSTREGMPKALLEAMSCGLACVVTDAPGSVEVVTHEITGLISEPDPDSLRLAISRLTKDNSLSQKFGRAAREYVVENFSLKNQLAKEVNIYEQLLS